MINGKTGIQLVWDWLRKNDMAKFVTKVTAEKPRAVAYIDDKAVRFDNWNECLDNLKSLDIVNEK